MNTQVITPQVDETPEEVIPIIWKKPHHSGNILHIQVISGLLHNFIQRYQSRLQMTHIMIDVETPNNSAGFSHENFIIKLHITLKSGKLIIAESQKRDIKEAMDNVVQEIDNQTRETDRQKHHDSVRRTG